MKLKTAGGTDIGLKRKINEDRYLVREDLGLFIVADGMGGHRAGEVASGIVVETMTDYWTRVKSKKNPAFLRPYNKEISEKANHLLNSICMSNIMVHKAQKKPEYLRMGSTVSAVFVESNTLWFANVGDSPMFLFDNGAMKLVSEVHSVGAEQKNMGLEKLFGSTNPALKNILTRVIGIHENVDVFMTKVIPKAGNIVLLCSDGLINYVSEESVKAVLRDFSLSLESKVKCLIDEANKGGGGDNITVILIEILEQGLLGRIKRRFGTSSS